MRVRSFSGVFVLVVVVAFSIVQGAGSAARRSSCLVSNERTKLGSRSLQEAIDAAAAGDTLVVKGTCFGASTVNKALTLQGVRNKRFGVPTLDGSGFSGNVLSVAGCCDSISVAIHNLTITHGAAAAICSCGYAGHTIELTRTAVVNNQTGIGGSVNGSGLLSLVDSTVSGNVEYGIGWPKGAATLLRSRVQDNGGVGVGIGRSGFLSLTDSNVSGNGGVGIGAFQSHVDISGSTVNENDGSGIQLTESSVALTDSSVTGNTTSGSGGGIGGTSTFESANVSLTNSIVAGNTAAVDGGGIYVGIGALTLINSIVSGNTAGGNGGGIYIHGYPFALTDSTVSGNSASSGGGIYFVPSFGAALLTGTNTFTDNFPDDCVGVAGC
jgi:hypothetical protein